MWVGMLITLLIGGFIFYALATVHKHIEDSENDIQIINNTYEQSKALENNNTITIKKNMTVKSILNAVKNKFKKSQMTEQKFVLSCVENKRLRRFTNKDFSGLYLFENIGNSILYTYGMLVAVSLPKVPNGWAIRTLTGWWWTYCLLVAVAYKASMTAILANPDTR